MKMMRSPSRCLPGGSSDKLAKISEKKATITAATKMQQSNRKGSRTARGITGVRKEGETCSSSAFPQVILSPSDKAEACLPSGSTLSHPDVCRWGSEVGPCSGQSSHAWLSLMQSNLAWPSRFFTLFSRPRLPDRPILLATGERVDVSGMQGCCRGTWERH